MSSPWSCPVCTFRNEGSCSYCHVCEQPKVELESAEATRGRGRPHDPSRPHRQHRYWFPWESRVSELLLPAEVLDFRDGDEFSRDEGSGGGRRPRSLVSELSEYVSDSTVPSLLNDALAGFVTASFGFAGATIGAVAGAVAGRATHSGVVRGAGLGALAGAIVCVEALEASRSYVNNLRAGYPPPPREDGTGAEEALASGFDFDVPHHHVALVSGPAVGGMAGLLLPRVHVHRPHRDIDILDEIPVYTVDAAAAASAEKCPICLDFPKEQDVMRVFPPCRHTFHRICIDRWLLLRNYTCPVCRQCVFQ